MSAGLNSLRCRSCCCLFFVFVFLPFFAASKHGSQSQSPTQTKKSKTTGNEMAHTETLDTFQVLDLGFAEVGSRASQRL